MSAATTLPSIKPNALRILLVPKIQPRDALLSRQVINGKEVLTPSQHGSPERTISGGCGNVTIVTRVEGIVTVITA
jgi:hypothetical protein